MVSDVPGLDSARRNTCEQRLTRYHVGDRAVLVREFRVMFIISGLLNIQLGI